MGKGGFQIIYSPDNNSKNNKTLKEIMTNISNFITLSTSVITIDFSLLNLELEYICPIIIQITKENTGMLVCQINIYMINPKLYSNSDSFLEMIFEMIFLLAFTIYVIFTIYYYKYQINFECFRIIEKEKLKNSQLVNNVSEVENNEKSFTFFEKFWIFVKIIILNFSSFSQLISFILNIVCIVFWVIFYSFSHNPNLVDEYNKSGLIQNTIDSIDQDKLIMAGIFYQNYVTLICVNITILFLKLINIIIENFSQIEIIKNTIIESTDDLISFFILLFVSYFAIFIFVYMYYGRNVTNYMQLIPCLYNIMSDLLTSLNTESIDQMYKFSPIVTFLYLIILVIGIKLIMLYILLSILMYNFNKALEKFEHNLMKKIVFDKMSQKKILKLYPENSLMFLIRRYVDCIHYFFKLLSFKCFFEKKNKKEEISLSDSQLKEEGIIVMQMDSNNRSNKGNLQKVTFIENSKINDKSKNNLNEDKSSILIGSNRSKDNLINDKVNEDDEVKITLLENENEHINKLISSNKEIIKIKDLKIFNIDFIDTLNFEMKNKYFESEKDQIKISAFYEEKYIKTFKDLIIYSFYLLSFVIVYVLNSMSPWKYIVRDSMNNIINFNNSNNSWNVICI